MKIILSISLIGLSAIAVHRRLLEGVWDDKLLLLIMLNSLALSFVL